MATDMETHLYLLWLVLNHPDMQLWPATAATRMLTSTRFANGGEIWMVMVMVRLYMK
jgi:hypothetical protein